MNITTLRKSSLPSSITEPGWSVDEYTPSDTPIALCLRGYHASTVVASLGAGLSGVTVWLPREVAAELGILPRAADTRIERALAILRLHYEPPKSRIATVLEILAEPAP